MITYFRDGKEGSREERIFRNSAVIWLFGIAMFQGIIFLSPLYHTIYWQKTPTIKPLRNMQS